MREIHSNLSWKRFYAPEEHNWLRFEVSRPFARKKAQERGTGRLWRCLHGVSNGD
jgi:hypothetical protein